MPKTSSQKSNNRLRWRRSLVLGIDDQKAYIGYNGGIKTFNIESLTLGEAIAGVNGQIGNMCYAYGKVFAVSDENLYIIDAKTDKVEKAVTGAYDAYKSVVTAKDGSVWVAAADKFIVYNPNDLKIRKKLFIQSMLPFQVHGVPGIRAVCVPLHRQTRFTGPPEQVHGAKCCMQIRY